MGKKEFLFSFKDDETAKKFTDYVKTFAEDKELNQKIQEAQSEDQVYEILKEKNLINMSFQEFLSALDQACEKMGAACDSSDGELSFEELESVVGGSIFSKNYWKKNWKKVVSYVPFIGDLTVTVAEIATGEVKGAGHITSKIAATLGGIGLEVIGDLAGCGIGGYVAGQIYTKAWSPAIKDAFK
jgi:hypothetical protein